MTMARLPTLAAMLTVLALGVACGHDKSTPTSPSSGPVTSIGLRIYGTPTTPIGVGQTVYLRVVELLSDNTSRPVNAGVSWDSSPAGVATIAATGAVLAISPGSASVTASYLSHAVSVTIRVVQNWADLDFRVVILNGTGVAKPYADVTRVFNRANDLLFERTGARMRLIDMQEAGSGTPSALASAYMDAVSGEPPDGIVVWSDDATATGFGGYSQTLVRPAPYANRFPAASGSNRVYVSAIDYEHKYARCGYDTTGTIRIGDKSANGECRNQSGLTCVDNGRFWECPDVHNDFYAQPDVFTASSIVHEFMHPVGTAGNSDHYGTSTCTNRVGMTAAEAADLGRFQWHCGMCPDLFLRFRPVGAPSTARTGRAR